jgi:Putative beta-barrel porin 2
MKKLTAIAGSTVIGVLGVAGAHAQTVYGLAPNLTSQELSKTWSVQCALRGFYDDNYTTAPDSSPAKQDSFGFAIEPSVSLNLPREQTYIGFTAGYSGRYFEDREDNNMDHAFLFTGALTHTFSPQYKLDIRDNFVVAQESELIEGGTPLRSEGDNIRNTANVTFTAGLTETVSLALGYANTFVDYDQDGFTGSYSSTLDRMEHLLSLTGRMQIAPPTTLLAGYQYGMADYTSDDLVAPGTPASVRDSRSHFLFGGVEHSFSPQLAASLRGGAQMTDFPDQSGADGTVPYVDGTLSWTYNPGSYLMAGIRHQRNATDVATTDASGTTTDTEASVFYAAVNHQLTAKLTGSLLGQYQMSEFKNGPDDGENEDFFTVGLNFAYRINQFLSAEAGYNFDLLDSDVPNRDFERNRVYLGLRAIY